MRRVERLRNLYESAISDLTQSGEAWKSYLRFASSIYKYSFDNTLLIYSQNPEATMLAPLPVWNKIGRRVNFGAKSIAVCDFEQDHPSLVHLFDITQTTGQQLPTLWSLDSIDPAELAGRLTSYDTPHLNEAIAALSREATLSSIDELFQDIELDIQEHWLGSIPWRGLEQHMQDLVQDSIRFLVHCRCKLPEPEDVDFSTIIHFDSLPLATRLGHQVNMHARSLLQDIARHIKIMKHERSATYEQERKSEPDLSQYRRPPLSPFADLERTGSGHETAGPLRTNGAELSAQPSPATLPDSSNARQPDEENGRSRTRSPEQDGVSDRTASPASSIATDRRYTGENTSLESDQGDRRRTDLERHRIQTEIASSEPFQEPLESGSFFSPDDDNCSAEEMLEVLLQRKQGEETLKPRIYQFVTEHYPIKPGDLVPVLKNAYGIGGARGELGFGLQGYMTNSKGIELLWMDANGEHETTLTWNKVASTLLTLIREGRYSESLPPFPSPDPEWTLFSYATQLAQNEQEKQRTEITWPSAAPQNQLEPASSPVSDHSLSTSSDSSSSATITTVSIESNYHFDPSRSPYVSGPKSKYRRNVEAIRLLKHLETEQRQATPEEQHILAGYVGWGGLANAFHPSAAGWEHEYAELKQLLNEDEYAAARSSTITSFYTEQAIIRPIHDTLKRFGLTDGTGRKLLEPSLGTGNFFSVLPPGWEKAELHGVELDPLTGRIARQLYPSANIRLQGFETVNWNNTRFDAIFSNVPFHNIRVFDKRYTSNYLIHDYFFIKSLDLLKPGGILSFIVSKGTLDKQDASVRKLIAHQAEWIGAVRLPNTAFQSLAGTTATTDIVFLQKRAEPIRFSNEEWPEWVEVGKTTDDVPINRYYLSHPEMVLGRMVWDRGMYGAEQTTSCLPLEDRDFLPALEQALHSLQATFPPPASLLPSPRSSEHMDTVESERREAPVDAKNFTYIIEENRIYYCENGELLLQDVQGKKAERIKGLCEIRTALLDVIHIQSQEDGYNEAELATAQHQLNHVYDRFVRTYGPINERANINAFADDDQLPLLRSIEDFTPEKTWVKAAIFFRPTIRPNRLPEHTESALEAMQICLNHRLRIDLPYIAYLCNQTTDEVREELGERIYLNPQKYSGDIDEGWELDEEYLSGHVKDKLAYAMLKAKEHPELFTRNVEALTRVQPAPLLPGDIDFRIGSPWIPVRYYRDFMYETLGTAKVFQDSQTVDVDYLEYTNTWRVSGKSLERDSIKVHQTYGTNRVNAYEIYENSLNLQSVTVRDPVTYLDANGNEQVKYVVNAKETMIARAKQQQMREAFASWLFRDKERADTLLAIYNDKFNTIRPRHYNGDHLTFPGMSEEMELRKHQKDVAARILYSGTALIAHEVGAGKTAAMIAAGMTLKHLGVVQKPMYCVPNHLTEQWANEFLRFFPAANILVTTKKDFALANRQRFVSRIAMSNYDAIIIGHSQFEKISISRKRQERLLEGEIRSVARMIDQMKKEKGDDWSIKQMVVFEKNLKSRLERLANEQKKDDLLTFEQLGVDMLFVDEAHAYKNCFTYTKMRNVAGIGKSSSQRATDMMLKCQYLQEMNSGRGVVFATGTPISNSMSEMYVMQRYLQPHLLKKLGLDFFDNWAATFGEVVTSLEITPEGSGYRMKSRFAKFHNLPELMSLFRLVADIQTADMLNLPTPRLEGDQATIVVSECTPYQKIMMNEFVERAEKIRNNEVDATEDNMLKLTHEAKLMSIDPRLVDEEAPSDPDSKLNRCITQAFDIWQQTQTDRLTQVIFCDSGTPKPGQFNVYDEIKTQLTLRGVPEQEIAFIHDAKTDVQREALFEEVRRGEVRILLGSTQKMGTGTNVQDRLVAAHHLDCPWRPADITQRDGRILRQGNRNEVVQIFRYVTKGTFDAYLWQIQEQKLRYISQVMTGKSISRSCEDADETVLSAAEVKAVATGNPMLAEKMHVDNEVTRLKLLKANWQNERMILESRIKQYPQWIENVQQEIQDLQTDMLLSSKFSNHPFAMELDGTTFTERPKAGEMLLLLFNMTEIQADESMRIGSFRGFDLFLARQSMYNVHLEIKGAKSYAIDLGESELGNLSRIENAIEKIPALLEDAVQKEKRMNEQFIAAQNEVDKPFEFDETLQQMVARQSEINSALEFEELQAQEIVMDEQPGEEQTEHDKQENTEELDQID